VLAATTRFCTCCCPVGPSGRRSAVKRRPSSSPIAVATHLRSLSVARARLGFRPCATTTVRTSPPLLRLSAPVAVVVAARCRSHALSPGWDGVRVSGVRVRDEEAGAAKGNRYGVGGKMRNTSVPPLFVTFITVPFSFILDNSYYCNPI